MRSSYHYHLRSLASFRRIKPTTVASFQLKGYVRLAILVDPTRWLAHHWLEHCGSADFAGMTVISMHYGHCPQGLLEAGSWLDASCFKSVGTAMSVELDTTHQGFCCAEPLNLAQHISLIPSPHACSWSFTFFYMQRWKWVKGSYYNIVLSLPVCAANVMQRAEDFVL